MALVCFVLVSTSGCGPRLSPAELGEIQKDPAELPGADEPYPLRERLGVVNDESAAADSDG